MASWQKSGSFIGFEYDGDAYLDSPDNLGVVAYRVIGSETDALHTYENLEIMSERELRELVRNPPVLTVNTQGVLNHLVSMAREASCSTATPIT